MASAPRRRGASNMVYCAIVISNCATWLLYSLYLGKYCTFVSMYFNVCVDCCLCPNGITDPCMHERLTCPNRPVFWNHRIAGER
jgi:hypothetical protein